MKILVNSMPKSGTHLLKRFCDLTGAERYRMNLMGSLLRQTSRNPLRNWAKRQRTSPDGIGVDLSFPENKANRKWLHKRLSEIPDNNYILGHSPYSRDLVELLTSLDFKVIHIYRNPRDLVVSLMNHFLRFDNYPFHKDFVNTPTTEERLLLSIRGLYRGNGGIAPLSQRLAGVEGWKHDDKVLAVEFDMLIGEKGGGNRDDQMKLLASMLAFVDKSNYKIDEVADALFFRGAETFNKGQIKQWESLFTPKVEEAFQEQMYLFNDLVKEKSSKDNSRLL